MNVFYCDFETCVHNDETWVWLACALDNDGNYLVTNTIEKFIDSLKGNCTLYFHNLKFDGSFILNYLLREGYKYKNDKTPLKNREFKCLIDNFGIYYSIEFKKKSCKIKCLDSFKIIPMSEAKIAESFKLPTEKGKIDYEKYRERYTYQPTQEEIEYIKNDCYIIQCAHKYFLEKSLSKNTIASNALMDFKKRLPFDFEDFFPIIDIALDKEIRKYYKGGFCYCVDYYAEMVVHNVDVYDVNSLYPDVMYHNIMPCGKPFKFYGEYNGDRKLYLQHIKACFKVKKDHLPTIQIKNNRMFVSNIYMKSSDGEIVDLYLTNIDLLLFKEHYDIIYMEYIDGYEFKTITNLFNNYIDYWIEVKKNNTGGIRQLAKLMLNSLYGKFANDPIKINSKPVLIDGVLHLEKDKTEETKPIYTALAVFITAYARYKTITTAQNFYKDRRLLYCDTDSIHCLEGETYGMEIDSKKLGAWDHEKHFKTAKYIHQKCYYGEKADGENVFAVAGLPKTKEVKEKLNIETFQRGFEDVTLKSRHLKGGVGLIKTKFKIR